MRVEKCILKVIGKYNPTTMEYVFALKSCHCVHQGQVIHKLLTDKERELDPSVGVALVAMYVKCFSIDDAHNVYIRMHTQDGISLAAILSGYTNQGHGDKALQIFEKQYADPDVVIFICVVKACNTIGAIMEGKIIHAYILEKGFGSDHIIGNALVDMYAKCKSMLDAFCVFQSIQKRDVVSWCTLITGYVDQGFNEEAILMFNKMQQEDGILPNRATFLCLLRAFASLASLEQGRWAHVNLSKYGMDLDIFVGSTLIDMYAKCHCIEDARYVFDKLHLYNVVSWSVMISGYFEHGQNQEALLLFKQMQEIGIQADKGICVCILRVCTVTSSFHEGKLLHIEIVKKGFDLDSFVGSSVVGMYMRCGSIQNACEIFDRLSVQDISAWSTIITGHLEQCGQGHTGLILLEQMIKQGFTLDAMIFVDFIKACSLSGGLFEGESMHFEVIVRGLDSNVFISSAVVDMYANCGCIGDAYHVFSSIPLPNIVLCNSMISRFTDVGLVEEAFKVFEEMQRRGIESNRITTLCILKTCSCLGALIQGHQIYTCIASHGTMHSMPFVGNALIDMYARCGSIEDACNVFNNLEVRDVVSWTAIIGAHADSSYAQDALELFEKMQHENIEPNEITIVCVLHALANLRDIYQSTLIHHYIAHYGFELNHHIASTLIDVYGKCGNIDEALHVFDMMPVKNVVAWSTLVSMCARCGYDSNVSCLFTRMQMEGMEPNEIVYMHALEAFSNEGTLDLGKSAHVELSKRGLELDLFVGNMLVVMYSRCGSLIDASKVFEMLPDQLTLVSWNAMISGLADYGDCTQLHLYLQKMEQDGFNVDNVTFTSLLSLCSHGGLIQEGCKLLEVMKGYVTIPSIGHYVCIVDMLGRAGFLLEAEENIHRMPLHPDSLIWMTLLGAAAKYNNVDVGRRAFDHLVTSNCKNDAAYVLMSNIYAANQMWED